jgi:hypothetical protein
MISLFTVIITDAYIMSVSRLDLRPALLQLTNRGQHPEKDLRRTHD